MDVQELLTELQALGVVLAANDGRLQVDAPKGIITPAIRAELARHKAALLPLLGSGGQETAPTQAAHNPGAHPGRPRSAAPAPTDLDDLDARLDAVAASMADQRRRLDALEARHLAVLDGRRAAQPQEAHEFAAGAEATGLPCREAPTWADWLAGVEAELLK